MFDIADFMQWDRLITPSIIKIFFYCAAAVAILFGLAGIIGSFAVMTISPLRGLLEFLASIIGIGAGVLIARIGAEMILVFFRMNDNLDAIRSKGSM